MRPSAKQLIEGIDWSLQNRVATVTEDRWAASTLRSTHCLLQHLAARVDAEGQILHDDNADLRSVLAAVAAQLAETPWGPLRSAIDAALARRWRDPADYPTVTSLGEENECLRSVVEDLLSAIHVVTAGLEETAEAVLAELDGYLARRRVREQPLFIPAFTASNF